jgi:hypothetical protein
MIKIENVDVLGWEAAIRGMRNPMNSWDKSDSYIHSTELGDYGLEYSSAIPGKLIIGPNDLKLMKNLANAGNDHGKFMRMIVVYADITAPLYFYKEFDTYKVGTVANSCSTMHKIQAKEFTMNDFSHEHMDDSSKCMLRGVVGMLEANRREYLETKDKQLWWNMIQLLPSSYNQKRTVQLNYAVLKNMYHARKNHKLQEWHDFCDFIRSLPYSELITGEE